MLDPSTPDDMNQINHRERRAARLGHYAQAQHYAIDHDWRVVIRARRAYWRAVCRDRNPLAIFKYFREV